jgi:hypothetical protein
MKKKPVVWMARQGDVMLRAVARIPEDATAHVRKADGARVVLAYGEVTGHAHALDAETVVAYGPSDDAFWLDVTQPGRAIVTHEEHAAIAIPANVRFVEVRRQMQYSPAAIERVAD